MPAKKAPNRLLINPTSIKITPAIEKKIDEASAKTGLKKQDIMRLSVERGVDVLLAQLTGSPNVAA